MDSLLRVLGFVVLVLGSSCTSGPATAMLDDIASGARAGYEIELVDGVAATRRQSTGIITYVPLVLVAPGPHLLLLRRRDSFGDELPETQTLEISVEAGHRYALHLDGDQVRMSLAN